MNHAADDRTRSDREVEELLELYAERRLRPDAGVTRALRASLVARAAATAPAAAAPAPRTTGFGWARRRRVATAIVGVAAVVVLAGGAFAGSRPGGPLYDLRLWVEEAMAPADPAAHAEAEIDQLDQRIDEVVAAITAGDERGAAAALFAYGEELDDAVLAVSAEPGSFEAIEAHVRTHLLVLEGLVDVAPEAALPGLMNAIERSSRVLERLQQVRPGKPSDAPGKPSDAPGKPSDAPGKPSEAPGKPSEAPGKPSEAPGKPSEAPGKPSDTP